MSRTTRTIAASVLLGLVLTTGCKKKEEETTTGPNALPPGPTTQVPGTSGGLPPVKTSSGDVNVLKVKNALVTNKEKLGIKNLDVSASGNQIVIRGTVANDHMKALADKVAAPVAGGMTIKNELQIASP